MTTHQEPAKWSVHLDAIRGVAALIVFSTHATHLFLRATLRAALGGTQPPVVGPLLHGTTTLGHQAVMVFFVLSGFLVGGSVLRSILGDKWSWGSYLLQRFTRLWVVLIPALLIGYTLDSAGNMYFQRTQSIYAGPDGQGIVETGLADRLALPVIVGNLFFLQGVLVPNVGTNGALWSLAFECWFYVAFPLLVLSLHGQRSLLSRGATGLLLILLLYSLGGRIAAYFAVWLIGAGIALVPKRIPARVRGAYCLSTMAIFMIANIFVLKVRLPLILSDDLIALSFALALYGILHYTERSDRRAYRIAAHGLANMSYTLYATHIPLLVFASAMLARPWQRWPMTFGSLSCFGLVIAAVFAVSYLSYRVFEARTREVREIVQNGLVRVRLAKAMQTS
jgi:peptidoglycan/LPS O-acetylase OafA/YrhL